MQEELTLSNFYLQYNSFDQLRQHGKLNGWDTATDYIAGMCGVMFAWPINLGAANPVFTLDMPPPVDDDRNPSDPIDLRSPALDAVESTNRAFWQDKLDGSQWDSNGQVLWVLDVPAPVGILFG